MGGGDIYDANFALLYTVGDSCYMAGPGVCYADGRPLLGVHNAAEATDEQQTSKQTNIIGFIAVICRESHRRCLKSSLKQR